MNTQAELQQAVRELRDGTFIRAAESSLPWRFRAPEVRRKAEIARKSVNSIRGTFAHRVLNIRSQSGIWIREKGEVADPNAELAGGSQHSLVGMIALESTPADGHPAKRQKSLGSGTIKPRRASRSNGALVIDDLPSGAGLV